MTDASDLQRLMVHERIGRAVPAVVLRDGRQRTIELVLDELPIAADPRADRGLTSLNEYGSTLWAMRAPAAVGREAELAEVDLFLGQACAASCALALEGDAGIGKTTIWQETVDRARGAGMLVLACRPAAAEAKLSFSGLSDMLAGVQEPAFAALPDLQRNALEVALLRSDA